MIKNTCDIYPKFNSDLKWLNAIELSKLSMILILANY